MHHVNIIERYFFFALLLLTLGFVVVLFQPFLGVLVIGASLSVVFHPVHKWLSKKLPEWLSALLVVIIFVVILCGPIFGIGVIVFNEIQDVYQNVISGEGTLGFVNNLQIRLNNILPEGTSINLGEKIADIVSSVSNNIAKIFAATFSLIFYLILTVLSLFYFLKDGDKWRKFLVSLSPLSDKDDSKILNKLSRSVNGVITGYLLIALLQGLAMGIGLSIFGVPNPALWGVVAGLSSLIPTIGTATVSIPSFIYLMATGHEPQAIGYAIWAVMLVGSIDNFLNPIVIGSKINLPPLLVLFSVLGGIAMMGPVGILIGPLSVSLLYALISIYRSEFQTSKPTE